MLTRLKPSRKEPSEMKFIGREKEKTQLSQLMDTPELSTGLIYGRRRVGKSELVKHVLEESHSKSFYYECKQVSQENNASSLADVIADKLHLPKLGFSSIEDILRYVFELAKEEKYILVLDEYPYLKDCVKGMDSILQSLIDQYREKSKLTLIILGSYVEVMKSLLEADNPLYGRIDLCINLKQMDYYDASKFYDGFSFEDKIRLYSVFGGIPYYNRLIDSQKSVKENIIHLIASSGARLENEVPMYLNSEISKIVNANEVIETLAKGYSRYQDVFSQSHVSSSPTLADVLDKLMKMDIVQKIAPINDKGNKRKAGYYICDNLSLFYYRYIFRYSSQLSIMTPEVFYEKYIQDDFETQYVPHRFEEICRQYLVRKNRAGLIQPVIEDIGKYYYDDPKSHTNGEFDLVTRDEKGYIFYEAKFKNKPLQQKDVEEEIAQVKATSLDCYRFGFISRSGFAFEKQDNLILIDLKELFDNID